MTNTAEVPQIKSPLGKYTILSPNHPDFSLAMLEPRELLAVLYKNISRIYRYAGASRISVAQHTFALYKAAAASKLYRSPKLNEAQRCELILECLVHDLHEGLVGDSSKFLTHSLKPYTQVDLRKTLDNLRKPIREALDLELPTPTGFVAEAYEALHSLVVYAEMALEFPDFYENGKFYDGLAKARLTCGAQAELEAFKWLRGENFWLPEHFAGICWDEWKCRNQSVDYEG